MSILFFLSPFVLSAGSGLYIQPAVGDYVMYNPLPESKDSPQRVCPSLLRYSRTGVSEERRDDLVLGPGEPRRGNLTVYPYHVGIIICNGRVEGVFPEGTRRLPGGAMSAPTWPPRHPST